MGSANALSAASSKMKALGKRRKSDVCSIVAEFEVNEWALQVRVGVLS